MTINQKIESFYKCFFYGKGLKLTVFFTGLILFKKPIEKVFEEYVINPFLSYIDENIFSDYCFLFIAVLIIIYFIPKFYKPYIISNDLLLISNFCLLCYLLFYRLNNDKLAYFDYSYLNKVAYADLIILYVVCVNVLKFKTLLKILKKRKITLVSFFKEDAPIKDFKEDFLNRKELAESVAIAIKETNTSKSAAFGIVGEWGTGKTSLMNLVKGFLDKDQFILIDFSPWISFSKNDIIHDFFKSISDELKMSSSELSDLLMSYAKDIANDKKFNIFSSLSNVFEDSDFNLKAKRIESILSDLDKRIVVFIDDLDRVESCIIVNIIQLIRSSVDFKNLIFIVGYDKGYVSSAIKNVNSHNYETYLEKIFLNEFTLPKIDENILQNYLENSFINVFPRDEQLNNIFSKKESYRQGFKFDTNIIKTIRDVKRFSNFFISSYNSPNIQGEVCVEDFIRIELLRYKYYLVYLLLETNWQKYLTKHSNKIVNLKKENRYVLAKDVDQNKSILENVLRDNMSNLLLSSEDIEIIMNLLYLIFDESEDYMLSIRHQSQLSIIYNKNIKKYFSRRIDKNELSHKEFLFFYNKEYKELQPKVIEWLDEGKRNLVLTKFDEIKSDWIQDIETYKKIIKIYFEIGRHKDFNSNSLFQMFDYDSLIYSIRWDKKTENIFLNEKETFISFIKGILDNAPYPYYFDSDLLDGLREQIEYDFILPKEEVEELKLGYLRKFCDETLFYSSDVWGLMHNCEIVTWSLNSNSSYTKSIVRNPKALKIVLEYCKKYPHEFIPKMVDYKFERKAISSIVQDLFGSFESFKKFINEFDDEVFPYLIDMKGLYTEFEKVGFKDVSYKFAYLPDEQK